MRKEPTLLFGYDAEVAQWVLERIPHVRTFGACAAIGVGNPETGKLYAGVVYHDHEPTFETMQVSIAAVNPMWATRRTVHNLLRYPFEQVGVHVLWSVMRSDNARALKTNQHIGFKREAVLGHRFGKGVHAIVTRMTAPEYRRLYGDK